jgi:hypothetical protein
MTVSFALRVYSKEYNIHKEPLAGENAGKDLFEFMQRKGK